MIPTVYDYQDYRLFLRDWIQAQGRGEHTRLAEALGCHLTYLSHILGGKAQLSPEQADSLNAHCGHSDDESEYLLMLVLHDRAGTPRLRDYYSRQLRRAVERRLDLQNRLKTRKAIGREEQATYYSAWYYLAIHLLLGLPGFRSAADRPKLARHLGLPPERVNEAVDFLLASGLVQERGGHYERGAFTIHLGNDSPLLRKHHVNWRMQAIQALDRERAEELHYSSVATIAREDALKIKSALVEAIECVRGIVQPSAEETVYCYALDFFEVRNG